MRILLLCFIGLTNVVFGQDSDFTIRVIDASTKRPIKNASIVVLGTTKGTSTNYSGFCKLNLSSEEKKLVVSHVSYQTTPIEVPQNVTSFAIPLQLGINNLPDIDLSQYPNKFNPNSFKKTSVRSRNLLDSMIIVESYSDFPYEGGIQFAFKEYFGNAFQFPEVELRANKSGKIVFEFTIDKEGGYSYPKCYSDSLSQICDELKRVLTVIPKWKPAEQYGEPVTQTFLLNVYYAPNEFWKKKYKK